MTARIDPHVHSVASYDGHTTPGELVERAADVGLDGVVVTDHDTVEGARVTRELVGPSDPLVIVGCEVSTADGHLLAIGIDRAPEPGRSLARTAAEVREAGGVAVVPHPFQRSRHGASAAAIEGVDGVEVHNALTLTNYRNDQARRFAVDRGLPAFGGSDAHRPGEIGRAATVLELDAPLTESAVLDAMRTGRTTAVGHRSSTRQFLTKAVDTAKQNALSLF
jgi:predicted metal-dependent phosphoesterase TrpH